MWYGKEWTNRTMKQRRVETDSCVQTEQRDRTGSPKNWLSQDCHTVTSDIWHSHMTFHMTFHMTEVTMLSNGKRMVFSLNGARSIKCPYGKK